MTTIPFLPKLGGMGTAVALLARELVKLGCEVKVATATPSKQRDSFSYEVVRQASAAHLLRLYHWADVYLQHGPSLKFGWPVFIGHKPSFIVHHVWMNESSRLPIFTRRLRVSLLKRCRNLAVSNALGRSLPVRSQIVPNPYDDELFRLTAEVPRDRDLVFLGRLEQLKGVDGLVDALGVLKRNGYAPTLTIIGDGPMRKPLEFKARELGISDLVHFAGRREPGPELTSLLNRHKILVVPSRWEEPFGIVALEGIACGCVVIGSDAGGLPEAIGPCGVTFPNCDADALARSIESLLNQVDTLTRYRVNAKTHLAGYRAATVAERYLQLLAAPVST